MAPLRVAKFAVNNEENISGGNSAQKSPTETNIKQEDEGDDMDYGPPSSSGGRKLDQERSPEQETYTERKFLGPYNKVDNEVSIRCSTSNGNTEEEMMKKLGLPIKFTSERENEKIQYVEEGTIRERGRRGEKKTYYCEICLIELNSDDTMNSHIKGIRHMKKKISIAQQMEEAAKRGENVTKTTRKVIQIANPEPLKKKVPRRLHEKIQETMDPVVGLMFVKEYRAVSDIEMEPHYECQLCDKQGQSNGMFSHIMGSEHRQNFVEEKFENQEKYMDLSQRELFAICSKYRENDVKLSDVIITHNSDETYPWPSGKAPWSIEKGGTGIAPDNARENYGKIKKEEFNEYERKPFKQNDCNLSPESKQRKKNEGARSSNLPTRQSIKRPSSIKEAERYLESGYEMLKKVMDLNGMFTSKEKRIHNTNLVSIMNIAASQIEKLKSKSQDSQGDNRFHSRSSSGSSQSSTQTSASLRTSQSRSQRSPEPSRRRKRSRSISMCSSPSSARTYRRRM